MEYERFEWLHSIDECTFNASSQRASGKRLASAVPFHVPFECPQLSRKSRLRRQTFLFSGGSFHCSLDRASPPEETIPFWSTVYDHPRHPTKQTENEIKKEGRKKKEKEKEN